MKRIDRIIVLGGGSAGFMAAIALRAKLRDVPVTVVRSKDIGIIGVGEGSTVPLTRFLHYIAIGPKKFFEVAKPTWKLGLKFIWGKRPYFNYTFGPGMEHKADAALPKSMGFYCAEDMEFSDPHSSLMSMDRIFERTAGGGPAVHLMLAYHFENERFVEFLEGVAGALGVEIVEDTVADAKVDEQGVSELVMKSGRSMSADLYVDASGFASALLGRALGEPFIDFRTSLFCDRAVIGGWDRADSTDPADQVIKPYTTCETMPAGWAWQIEHERRINRGYVYCSDHASDEAAEREFRGRNPRVGPTRIVKFRTGRYEDAWVKNVVAIGNASGFVEPLEATALGVIAMQSRILTETIRESEREIRPGQRALFNRFNSRNWDSIRGFVALHYKFNDRLDTPFWQRCRAETDIREARRIVDFYEENGPTGVWGPTVVDNEFDQFTIAGYMTMLVGMRVPYRTTHVPTAAERASWEARRRRNRETAARAMTVRETIEALRSPKWKWGQ
jgi:tryptophan 7-halogenase